MDFQALNPATHAPLKAPRTSSAILKACNSFFDKSFIPTEKNIAQNCSIYKLFNRFASLKYRAAHKASKITINKKSRTRSIACHHDKQPPYAPQTTSSMDKDEIEKIKKRLSDPKVLAEIYLGAAKALLYTDEEIRAVLEEDEAQEFIDLRNKFIATHGKRLSKYSNDNTFGPQLAAEDDSYPYSITPEAEC